MYVTLGNENGGIVTNLAVEGVACHAAQRVLAEKNSILKIKIRGSGLNAELMGELVWIGPTQKELGIRFKDLSASAQKDVTDWIRRESLFETHDSQPVWKEPAGPKPMPAMPGLTAFGDKPDPRSLSAALALSQAKTVQGRPVVQVGETAVAAPEKASLPAVNDPSNEKPVVPVTPEITSPIQARDVAPTKPANLSQASADAKAAALERFLFSPVDQPVPRQIYSEPAPSEQVAPAADTILSAAAEVEEPITVEAKQSPSVPAEDAGRTKIPAMEESKAIPAATAIPVSDAPPSVTYGSASILETREPSPVSAEPARRSEISWSDENVALTDSATIPATLPIVDPVPTSALMSHAVSAPEAAEQSKSSATEEFVVARNSDAVASLPAAIESADSSMARMGAELSHISAEPVQGSKIPTAQEMELIPAQAPVADLPPVEASATALAPFRQDLPWVLAIPPEDVAARKVEEPEPVRFLALPDYPFPIAPSRDEISTAREELAQQPLKPAGNAMSAAAKKVPAPSDRATQSPVTARAGSAADKWIPPALLLAWRRGNPQQRALLASSGAACVVILVLVLGLTTYHINNPIGGSATDGSLQPSLEQQPQSQQSTQQSPPQSTSPSSPQLLTSPAAAGSGAGSAQATSAQPYPIPPVPPKGTSSHQHRDESTPVSDFLINLFGHKEEKAPQLDEDQVGVQVWTSQTSGYYYCTDTDYYKNVWPGSFMTQADAIQAGYRARLGNFCN